MENFNFLKSVSLKKTLAIITMEKQMHNAGQWIQDSGQWIQDSAANTKTTSAENVTEIWGFSVMALYLSF